MKIMRCGCGYTMKKVCEKCGAARSAHPARFSAADKHGKYRRMAKEQINTGKTE